MDCIIHGFAKSRTRNERLSLSLHFHFKDIQLSQAVEEGIMFNFMSKTVKWVLQDNF